MAVRQTIAWLMIPVAQLIGGYVADFIGLVNLFYASALLGTISMIIIWYLTAFQRVEAFLGLEEATQETTLANEPHPN